MKFSDWMEQRERKVPKKYFSGLKEKGKYGSKEAMKREIKKFQGTDTYKKDWDADYKDGKRIKTKKSAATRAYEKKFDENVESLKKKSEQSKISLGLIKKVYNRGKAAWNSGHRPGTAQEQWAMGRVNSFITGVGGSRKADKDLWEKARKKKA